MSSISTLKKTLIVTAAGGFAVAALAGCSSTASSSSASSSSPSATSSATTAPAGLCTEEAILSALPSGATMDTYNCATVEGTMWAGVKVNPGPTVFFLKQSGDQWAEPLDESAVCGTASAGLPPEILKYCEAPSSGSPSASKSKN